MKKPLTIFLIALLSGQQIAAQTSYPPLGIEVNPLDEDGRSCGLSEASMEAAMRAAMRYNRLVVEQSATASSFKVSVSATVIKPSSICVGSFSLKIRSYGYVPFGEKRTIAAHEVCSRTAVMSRANSLSEASNSFIKSAFDQCLAEIDQYSI